MAKINKDDLIRAMLPHVAFDGWSDEAFAAAATDCGISMDAAKQILPGGMADIIDAFVDMADRDMARALDALTPRPERVSEIIRAAILCRLEGAEAHRLSVTAALKFLAHPQHGAVATKTLYRTVDRIWRLTGDKSVDFSFYTKRATLAGVYSASLLYWVANPTANRSKIEAFVDQRLREIAFLPKVTAPVRGIASEGCKLAGRLLGRMLMRHSG